MTTLTSVPFLLIGMLRLSGSTVTFANLTSVPFGLSCISTTMLACRHGTYDDDVTYPAWLPAMLADDASRTIDCRYSVWMNLPPPFCN